MNSQEQNPNLLNPKGKDYSGRKEQGIRTMESDISKLLKEEKPSLIGLMTKGGGGSGVVLDGRKNRRPSWFAVGIGAISLIIVLVAGFFAYNYFFSFEPAIEKKEVEKKSTAYVSYDEEEDVVLKEGNEYSAKMNELAQQSRRFGTLKKLNVEIADGETANVLFKNLLKIWEASPPSDLEFIVSPEVQQFIYYSDSRPAFVSVFKVSDTNRALADMLSWESRIPAELEEFLLGATPEINIIFFDDKGHNGVSYRFAKRSFADDLGFGYFVVPEKKFLVIASTEEAIRIVINRLLEP